jgi:hypothetical protein
MSRARLSGKDQVSLESLRDIPMPSQTDSYVPVGHFDMAVNLQRVAGDLLAPKGFSFRESQYAIARDGQRMFGILKYKNGNMEMGMAIGFRNSYDRSMAAGIACGANVFVCDNMCFAGDIVIMRKHTKNVIEDLHIEMVQAIYRTSNDYLKLQEHAERMKTIDISTENGYKILGTMTGEEILTPTMTSVAFGEWREPSHEAFKPRTGWSLYNSITESLKLAPPDQALKKYTDMHMRFIREIGVN